MLTFKTVFQYLFLVQHIYKQVNQSFYSLIYLQSYNHWSINPQGMPFGIMKDMTSAVAPQSARLSWNTTTHAVMMPVHITAPMPERITSETEKSQLKTVQSPLIPTVFLTLEVLNF